MLSGEGDSGMDDIINRLQQHIEHHFRDEEEYMTSIGYPDLAAHKREHEEFTTRVAQLKAELKATGHTPNADTEFYNYVSHWMNNHFRNADREYVAFARSNLKAAQ